MEIFVYECGFIPGVEQLASHRRVRYRLTSAPNGVPVEPGLEIVHYTQAFPEHKAPARSIPVRPDQQKRLGERRFLEAQGGLPRKEFMLHDSANWPTLNLPSAPGAGNPYQQGLMYNRGGQSGPPGGQRPGGAFPAPPPSMRPGGGMGPSPAKRARQSGPPRIPSGGAMAAYAGVVSGMPPVGFDEAMLADEENAGAGDLLDMLSPQDISVTRYTQHHEWMEEILSSPYATSQIIPVNLGLTFVGGELSGLTNGLFDDNLAQPAVGEDYRAVKKSQVAELQKRVDAFVKSSEQQLAAMKEGHAKTMAAMSSQKRFVDYEKRLADLSPLAPQQLGQGAAKIDALVEEVSHATGTQVKTRKQVTRVQKGGLLGYNGVDEQPVDGFADDMLVDVLGDDILGGDEQQADFSVTGMDASAQPAFGTNGVATTVQNGLMNSGDVQMNASQSGVPTAAATVHNAAQPHPGSGSENQQHPIDSQIPVPIMPGQTSSVSQDTPTTTATSTTAPPQTTTIPASAPTLTDDPSSAPRPNNMPMATQPNTDTGNTTPAQQATTAPGQAQNASGAMDEGGDDAVFGEFADLDTAGEALDFYDNFGDTGTPGYGA